MSESGSKPSIYITSHARERYIERVLGGVAPSKRRLDREIVAFLAVHPEKCGTKKKGENSVVITTILP